MMVQNPWIFWAFLAAAVPLIIHLFGRQPRKTVRISSLMWLKEIKTSERRKKRLKDILVLLFRTLAIIFVVFSLVNWRSSDRVENLVIDNHPAHWEKQWYKDAINQLPDGVYRTFLRDGSYLGHWSKADLPEIMANVSPSNTFSIEHQQATLLSYGFDSIPPAQFNQILLPQRSKYDNHPIGIKVLQNSIEASVDSAQDLSWDIYRGGALYSTENGTHISLPKSMFASKDTFEISAKLDSVPFDNTITVIRESPKKTAVLTFDKSQCWSCSYFKPDTIFADEKTASFDASSFGVVLLEGFDFIPEELADYDGTLLMFYPKRTTPTAAAVPVLEHSFYSEHFLGPSLQNRWPKYARLDESLKLDEGYEPTLTSELGEVISGFSPDGQRYIQLFFPEETQHPFYEALFQFAGANSTLRIEMPPFLGTDHYSENLAIDGVQIFDNSTHSYSTKDQFWTREKIALALALLSVVLALIFAKI